MPSWAICLYLSALLSALVTWFRIPRRNDRWIKLAGLQVVLATLVELWAVFAFWSGYDQMPAVNLFLMVELSVLIALTWKSLEEYRKLVLWIGALSYSVFTVSAVFYGLGGYGLAEAEIINSLVCSVIAFLALWKIAETSMTKMTEQREFWYYLGALVFFGGNIPINGTILMIYKQDQSLAVQMYVIVPILITLRYSLTAYGFYLERKGDMINTAVNGGQ